MIFLFLSGNFKQTAYLQTQERLIALYTQTTI